MRQCLHNVRVCVYFGTAQGRVAAGKGGGATRRSRRRAATMCLSASLRQWFDAPCRRPRRVSAVRSALAVTECMVGACSFMEQQPQDQGGSTAAWEVIRDTQSCLRDACNYNGKEARCHGRARQEAAERRQRSPNPWVHCGKRRLIQATAGARIAAALSGRGAWRMAELKESCRQVVGLNSTTGARHGAPAPEGRCVPRMCYGWRLCATSPLSGWYCRCDARHAHHLFIHHGGPRCVGRPRLHQLDYTPCTHVRLCQRCCLRSCGCPCGKQTHYGW